MVSGYVGKGWCQGRWERDDVSLHCIWPTQRSQSVHCAPWACLPSLCTAAVRQVATNRVVALGDNLSIKKVGMWERKKSVNVLATLICRAASHLSSHSCTH